MFVSLFEVRVGPSEHLRMSFFYALRYLSTNQQDRIIIVQVMKSKKKTGNQEKQLESQLTTTQKLQQYGRYCDVFHLQHRLILAVGDNVAEIMTELIKECGADVVFLSNKPKKQLLFFHKFTTSDRIMLASCNAHFFVVNRRVNVGQNDFSRNLNDFMQDTENRAKNLTTVTNVEIYRRKKGKLERPTN